MQNWFELLCNMKHKCTLLLEVDRMIRLLKDCKQDRMTLVEMEKLLNADCECFM